jgi:galactokinase
VDDLDRLEDPLLRRRARHVVTENRRVVNFAACLRGGDLAGAGALMAASHASLREDFEVSTPALDAVVAELTAAPGVYGARLTGAGFGGCAVALADSSSPVRGWRLHPSGGAHTGGR